MYGLRFLDHNLRGEYMRIREVVEKTGIPKRTIYFYISQKLIEPEENPGNGYHDFSQEDVRRLIIISGLRRLDFSLADIKSILRFPGTASYYFYRQMDILEKRVEALKHNVDILGKYFESETAPADCFSYLENLRLTEEGPGQEPAFDVFTEQDARIIPLFIWAPYVTQSRSEYQDFIWTKISRRVTEDYRPFLHGMKRIISSLKPEQLTYSSDRTSAQSSEIAALKPDETEGYADKMLTQIAAFLEDEALVKKWNLVYLPFIHPLLTIGYSEISIMMFELNGEYKSFYDNVCILCDRLWLLLHNTDYGRELFQKMNERLLPINWEQNGRGELERMTVFPFSPYAILEEKEIKKILGEKPKAREGR